MYDSPTWKPEQLPEGEREGIPGHCSSTKNVIQVSPLIILRVLLYGPREGYFDLDSYLKVVLSSPLAQSERIGRDGALSELPGQKQME